MLLQKVSYALRVLLSVGMDPAVPGHSLLACVLRLDSSAIALQRRAQC